MPEEPSRRIDASPTKTFFINTITKDIDLVDAIFDLVDNSIDGHIKNDLKERRKIVISFSEDRFELFDDCGGIPMEEVYERVFRFGGQPKKKGKTIGVYGIGLKRAIFKIGRDILITSDDGENLYAVHIDEDWLNDEDDWDLDIEYKSASRGIQGTKITITNVYPDIVSEFLSTYWENGLRDRIRNTYSLFMDTRVDIEVNGTSVGSYDFRFLSEEGEFSPFHQEHKYNGVKLGIFAGYAPTNGMPHGWFVFCNDRLVLSNDVTERTGWGAGSRNYHYPEDNRFLGLAFFESEDPLLLPWQTTKDDVQLDSKVYRKAQLEMRSVTRRLVSVIRLTSRTEDPDTGETIGKSLFENVPTISWREVVDSQHETVPAIEGEVDYTKLTKVPDTTYIQYTAKRDLVKEVKKKLGDGHMSNKKMGKKTFEYYVDVEEVENE